MANSWESYFWPRATLPRNLSFRAVTVSSLIADLMLVKAYHICTSTFSANALSPGRQVSCRTCSALNRQGDWGQSPYLSELFGVLVRASLNQTIFLKPARSVNESGGPL